MTDLPQGECSGCDDSTGVDGPGTLSLLLTDAPGDFQEAWVTIERIDMVAEDEEIITLMDEPVTRDLLTLANDVESLVDGLTVPAGIYHQLRFIVPEACIVVESETEGGTQVFASDRYDACGTPDGELHMPSFDQSGIKVNFMHGGGAGELTRGGRRIG